MLLGWLLCASCGDAELSRHEQCVRVRDQLVSLRIAQLPANETAETAEAHRAALGQALAPLVTECEQRFDDHQIQCTLAASDITTASLCVEH
jgi:hypothetical protein